MRALRILSLAILLTGVLAFAQAPAAGLPASDTKQAQATVYIYRYKQFVGGALEPSVYCDDVQLARMENGRYFTVRIDPGKHTFHSNDPQSGVALDLKVGQPYFIRMEIATGLMKGHGRLNLISPEQGSYELKSSKLKPLDSSKVVDKARVSVEEAHIETPMAESKGPATAAPPSAVPSQNPEHAVTGETISGSNGTPSPASQAGDQVSIAEAARRAREKKEAAK
jgi:hypothetical protein